MIIVLLVITLTSAVAVGGVYILTKGPIEKAKQTKINEAIESVMPGFDNIPSQQSEIFDFEGQQVAVYPAKLADQLIGYAVETYSNNGFGGKISLMVGIKADGNISSISVIEHKETPGLGDKIEASKSDFGKQFEGKNPTDYKFMVKKDGGDVDAITASTITSRAYTDAINRAYRIVDKFENQGNSTENTQAEAYSGATSTK